MNFYEKELLPLGAVTHVYFVHDWASPMKAFLVEAPNDHDAREQALYVLKDGRFNMLLVSDKGEVAYYHQRGEILGLYLEDLSGNKLVNLRAVKDILGITVGAARQVLEQGTPLLLKAGKRGELEELVKLHQFTHLKIRKVK